jgi:hypothetical protein
MAAPTGLVVDPRSTQGQVWTTCPLVWLSQLVGPLPPQGGHCPRCPLPVPPPPVLGGVVVVVVVVAGGAVVVVVGAGGGTVVTVVDAFAASAVSAAAVLLLLVPLLLLGVKSATVAFALPCVVETGTPPGDGLVGVEGGGVAVLAEPPPPLAVPEPLTAGLEKSGFDGPGAPAFSALSEGALTVPVLTATTASESAAAATLTVAIKRFLTIPAALGPTASAIADEGTRPNGSGICLPKFLDAKTSSRATCALTSCALSGCERCIPPPVDWRYVQGLLRRGPDPRSLARPLTATI